MSDLEQTLSIIKPDAVERNLSEEIKEQFKKENFKILKEKKKLNLKKMKQKNFIKFINLNLFIMIYVHTYHQEQLL